MNHRTLNELIRSARLALENAYTNATLALEHGDRALELAEAAVQLADRLGYPEHRVEANLVIADIESMRERLAAATKERTMHATPIAHLENGLVTVAFSGTDANRWDKEEYLYDQGWLAVSKPEKTRSWSWTFITFLPYQG